MSRLMAGAIASALSLHSFNVLADTNCARELGAASTRPEVFACMVDLLEEIEALRDRPLPIPTPEQVKDAILADQRAREALRGEPGSAVPGMVVAFAGSLGCPPGWTLFDEAGGRFIVGAGAHDNVDAAGNGLTRYEITRDSDGLHYDVGGVETVTLTPEQIPAHQHDIELSDINNYLAVINTWEYVPREDNTALPVVASSSNDNRLPYEYLYKLHLSSEESGSGQEHENMPPYIALYWCTPATGGAE